MMPELLAEGGWLPVVFLLLMGIAMLAYVVLDGYDLGVGILLPRAGEAEQDRMIAAIGPFWDANETWLVLGIGILLVAFPEAHGVILTALYIPVALMLAGLILRGVAFDFRVKAQDEHQPLWDRAFFFGSLLATLAQGVMLGLYITGFEYDLPRLAFAGFVGLSLVAGYVLLGACWLVMKTEGELQRKAVGWARQSLGLTALGIAAISIATPLVSEHIFAKWFSLPNFILLAPIPLVTAGLLVLTHLLLRRLPYPDDAWSWAPFACAAGVFALAFNGLAYSLFPYLVIDRITIWQAASAPESLWFILVGVMVVLPAIIGYTAYSYFVFRGKARALHY